MSANGRTPLAVRAAALSAAFDPNYTDAGQRINPDTRPFPWTCANRLCRKEFMRLPYHSEYCPECLRHLKAGRGDLLDPVMYARCQQVIALEAVYEAKGLPACETSHVNGEAAWRALLGLPPLESDFDVDTEKDFADLKKAEGVVVKGHKPRGTGRNGR